MEFDNQNDQCEKCGSFKPWIIIKNKEGENVKRKCKGCEVLPVYRFIEYKNLNFPNDLSLCTTVYEPEPDRYIILGD